MKIPTLIGIALILALAGSLGFWFFNREEIENKSDLEISDLQLANISNTSVTIIWQTNLAATGQVLYGESENLNQKSADNRDLRNPKERLIHFVTLKNLKPASHYFYKITNNSISYPEKTLKFKTAAIANIDELNFSFIKPLKGTILNINFNPIDESLIFLKIPGVQDLATFSSTAGNFILPLKLVLTQDLNQIFNIPPNTPATLTVRKGKLESSVKFTISESTVNLPAVTIGSSLDLSNYVPTPITIISIKTSPQVNFDFNTDGKINSLDLAILREKVTSKSLLSPQDRLKFDINSDGVVDPEDVDVFSRSI